MRGGNRTCRSRSRWVMGSSPLARGKPPDEPPGGEGRRIIPACAGETSPSGRLEAPRRDHPRLRGGNAQMLGATGGVHGSSPLARGKPAPGGAQVVELRIIPACAGETPARSPRPPATTDHPRLRGGNTMHATEPDGRSGSSPLARGKLISEPSSFEDHRIIPACAGETRMVARGRSFVTDHPRLRGGNPAETAVRSPARGSSPLARGKRHVRRNVPPARGIIPACAGETPAGAIELQGPRDHPRLRGGNTPSSLSSATSSGSSPLARGKPPPGTGRRRPHGIIPACAGETRWRGRGACRRRDHPRLRGGNDGEGNADHPQPGSSPLARGKPN